MSTITKTEFSADMPAIAARVKGGEDVVITRYGAVVATFTRYATAETMTTVRLSQLHSHAGALIDRVRSGAVLEVVNAATGTTVGYLIPPTRKEETQ